MARHLPKDKPYVPDFSFALLRWHAMDLSKIFAREAIKMLEELNEISRWDWD